MTADNHGEWQLTTFARAHLLQSKDPELTEAVLRRDIQPMWFAATSLNPTTA